MQKQGKILALATLMMLPVLLVSCVQDDESVASFVDGYWEGELTADFYTYRGYETDYFYTQMQFVRTNAYGGYGFERDYNAYSNIPLYSNFNWSVKEGYIYIDYDQGEDVYAYFEPFYDSYVGRDGVRGVFRNVYNNRPLAQFTLYKLDYWDTNWNSYWGKKTEVEATGGTEKRGDDRLTTE